MSGMGIDQLSVLLVEPSAVQRKLIEGYLRELGVLTIATVQGGGEALALLHRDLPDVVVSAMHLPDMTGTELLQTLRGDARLRDVPFMLISSETHYRYLEPLRQAGVIAILPKPFEREQLRRALHSTLHYLDPGELHARQFASEELKVLVVDDSGTARRHICRVLRNMGIEDITQAGNGVEALALIREHFFDLVVTDYNMPQMDGGELVEQIRTASSQASVPILMVSSEADESRIAAVQQAGVSAICDKPFESGTVKRLIENMLG
jgi:two-component system chemotaxis response regulator CheY